MADENRIRSFKNKGKDTDVSLKIKKKESELFISSALMFLYRRCVGDALGKL